MRKALLLLLASALAVCTHARAQRTFNVAIGMVAADSEVSDPGFFQVLQTSGLKPADWTLTNPHRNVPGNPWAANLDTLSLPELLDYDLVQITNHQPTHFTDEERENIRQWVQDGGQIWIDDCGNMSPSNFFWPFGFASYETYPSDGAKGTDVRSHPIFNAVYALSDDEIRHLGHPDYSSHMIGYDPSIWKEPVFNIGQDGVKRPDMLLMEYGKGRIILSADDYSCAVNDYGNSEDIKLCYNILAFTQQPVEPPNVPEPASLALLGTGLMVLVPVTRKRK